MPVRIRRNEWFVIFALLWLPRPVAAATAQDSLDAQTILAKSDDAEGYRSCYFEMEQTLATTGGKTRTLKLRVWALENGARQLAEYLAPADIRGQKILMTEDGDNIWTFNPETRRTRKLGSHMKKKRVMGSDFSYEDQAGGTYSEKYTPTKIGQETLDGVDCFILELRPTPKGPGYEKLVAWVARKDFVFRRVDFYREGDESPFKRLIAEDLKTVGEKTVPHRVTMSNLEDGTETVNLMTRIAFDVEIPESVFEAHNLDR